MGPGLTVTFAQLAREKYLQERPDVPDAAEAMLQVVLVYASQGKMVEADAWRAKLLKEYPNSPAARAARESPTTGERGLRPRYDLESAGEKK